MRTPPTVVFRVSATLVTGLAALGLAACGDSGDGVPAGEATASTQAPPVAEDAEGGQGFCEAFAQYQNLDVAALGADPAGVTRLDEAVTRLRESGPPQEVAGDVGLLADTVGGLVAPGDGGDPAAWAGIVGSPEFADATTRVAAFAMANCS